MRALPLLVLFAGHIRPGCGSPLAGSETDCSREWNRDPRTLHRHSLFQKHVLQAQSYPGEITFQLGATIQLRQSNAAKEDSEEYGGHNTKVMLS